MFHLAIEKALHWDGISNNGRYAAEEATYISCFHWGGKIFYQYHSVVQFLVSFAQLGFLLDLKPLLEETLGKDQANSAPGGLL